MLHFFFLNILFFKYPSQKIKCTNHITSTIITIYNNYKIVSIHITLDISIFVLICDKKDTLILHNIYLKLFRNKQFEYIFFLRKYFPINFQTKEVGSFF